MSIKTMQCLTLWLVAGAVALAQEPLTVATAIRKAWRDQSGLKAGRALVQSKREEAAGFDALKMPTLTLQAQGVRTDEPMLAFGMKLNQSRIAAMDFNPSSLNRPDAIMGFGGSAAVQQPLYAGGRLSAAKWAGEYAAQAETASQARREQETAMAIVEAYFGAQVAEQALLWVEDTRTWILGLEAFVGARVQQGLMLESELQRLKAAHAQVDAQKADAVRQVRAARSGLGLLTGSAPVEVPLATPLQMEGPAPGASPLVPVRADLQAAELQARAAGQAAKAAAGSLKPEVGLELGAGTLRQSWHQGGTWTWAALGVKWKVFSGPDRAKSNAAAAQARAADDMRAFKQQQAEHEVRVAREALRAAEAKHVAAQEALAASEESKRLREARHREGLTPLTDLLDAEAALQGARTLLLQSLYDLRTSRAALDLATGTPIEGVTP
ncbi:MAG: TolC family protein [Holophagaceae bacterium]|nr:TolC family protein [Holophagaceae bacterium]